jgi:four helix bundle protein
MIKSYRDLRVWQAAIDLVEAIYRLGRGFPKHEMFGLTGQMQRAAVSVASNIAEGHAREHRKEFLHHLSIAQSSLAELETHVEIAAHLGYSRPTRFEPILVQSSALGKQLYALRNALASSPKKDGPFEAQKRAGGSQGR